jgi:hypothetical protein
MGNVSVTYKAPEGENKVLEAFGHTFFDGKPTDIEDTPANKAILDKIEKNPLFEASGRAAPTDTGQGYDNSGEAEGGDENGKAKKKGR